MCIRVCTSFILLFFYIFPNSWGKDDANFGDDDDDIDESDDLNFYGSNMDVREDGEDDRNGWVNVLVAARSYFAFISISRSVLVTPLLLVLYILLLVLLLFIKLRISLLLLLELFCI